MSEETIDFNGTILDVIPATRLCDGCYFYFTGEGNGSSDKTCDVANTLRGGFCTGIIYVKRDIRQEEGK